MKDLWQLYTKKLAALTLELVSRSNIPKNQSWVLAMRMQKSVNEAMHIFEPPNIPARVLTITSSRHQQHSLHQGVLKAKESLVPPAFMSHRGKTDIQTLKGLLSIVEGQE